MMYWTFGLVASIAGARAVVTRDSGQIVLALWITGMSAGCAFLSMGAEFLALLQWIISTLVALGLFVFSSLFGEGSVRAEKMPPGKGLRGFLKILIYSKNLIPVLGALVLGLGFAVVLVLASPDAAIEPLRAAKTPGDIATIGRTVSNHHILSLEVLAFALLTAVIGGGAVARAERSQNTDEGAME